MPSKQNVGGRDRLVRAVLAAVFSVLAVRTLKSGKYKSGFVVGLVAAGFGFNATTCFCGLNEALGIDTTSE